ncbi:hypothetical protein Hanom_Chr16g01498151 [Helianthus anomalus]
MYSSLHYLWFTCMNSVIHFKLYNQQITRQITSTPKLVETYSIKVVFNTSKTTTFSSRLSPNPDHH